MWGLEDKLFLICLGIVIIVDVIDVFNIILGVGDFIEILFNVFIVYVFIDNLKVVVVGGVDGIFLVLIDWFLSVMVMVIVESLSFLIRLLS